VKTLWRLLAVVSLSVVVSTDASAEETAADSSEMLKVPAAETRPTGDEAVVEKDPAPVPEEAPPAEVLLPEEADAPTETTEEASSIVPPAFPISRYEQLWERSPFQLESVAPPVESAGLAQRFALTGIAEINGEPIAFVMERATQRRLMVRKDSTDGDVSLVQVDVQQKYNDSTATLRQGAEVGVVRFDAAGAGAVAMPAPAMPQQRAMPGIPQPGMPQVPPTQFVPPTANVQPGQPNPLQPAPGIVPPVPGPGVPQNGQVQADPGQMPPPRVIRRRALIPAAP
jgi:hypothetical protein